MSASRARGRTLPYNTVCLNAYRQQAESQASTRISKAHNTSLSTGADKSAEIVLFTGVQIVRDDGSDTGND